VVSATTLPLLVALWAVGCGDDGSGQNNNPTDGSTPADTAVVGDGDTVAEGSVVCGNGTREIDEECDGLDLSGRLCESLGHEGGLLRCTDDCRFEESHCYDEPSVFRAADVADVCSQTPSEDCTPADMGFVLSEYGSIVTRHPTTQDASPVYRLVSFVERLGPFNIDVLVTDHQGNPMANVPVAFHWPDAPEDSRPDEWKIKKLTTLTGANGIAGFALGGGAYLPCCGCGGPHAVWISEPGEAPNSTVASDLADYLGMLGNTNHRHLDLIFQRVDPPPAGRPADAVRCPLQ
jgi:hypothetical protein